MLVLLTTLSLLAQDPVTDLGFVDVKGQRLQPIIRIEVDADLPLEAMIISEPQSVRCGARRFTYHHYMSPRQCWIRRPPGTAINLRAIAPAEWGNSWRVEWQNCPNPTPRTCDLTASREEQDIKATFVR